MFWYMCVVSVELNILCIFPPYLSHQCIVPVIVGKVQSLEEVLLSSFVCVYFVTRVFAIQSVWVNEKNARNFGMNIAGVRGTLFTRQSGDRTFSV